MARPTVFKPEYCTEIEQLMEEGALDYEICAKWNISKDTLWRWKNENQDFKEAYDRSIPKCEAWWSNWGKQGMQGNVKGFNFMAWQSFMNNKFKWTPKSQETSTQINIGNMNVLNTKSNTELVDYIKTKLIEVDLTQDAEYQSLESPKQDT